MKRSRNNSLEVSRRKFLAASLSVGGALLLAQGTAGGAEQKESPERRKGKAQIAISLDLEMVRNFPRWEDAHWDFEKGNLTDAAKNYAVEAARRVKAHGGVVHFFLVCRALEQENVDWLREIIRTGHAVGNHTYDHVYIRADKMDDVQYRFKRAPWLVEGKTPIEVIKENIQLANAAMKSRLGIAPAGFRAPGGFADGLIPRADLQRMLLDFGFQWVSTLYPAHPNSDPPGTPPTAGIFAAIVKAQEAAQPFFYPSGLLEIPMAPLSDIVAFRNGRWKLEDFLKGIRLNLAWAIERGAVYDFLSHPAVLSAMDPEFQAIELICDTVKQAGDRAEIVNLDAIAQQVPR
jgi:peptidoglycan/xylan/chitin deacetylase (PgdA/CDA1 family)